MSNTKTSQNQGLQPNENRYTNYANLLEVLKECQKKQPKSVSLKLQGQKHLYLQFIFPDTGKRSTKPCNVKFTEEGVYDALRKAKLVKSALLRYEDPDDFWAWYNETILEKKEKEASSVTYREIFEALEKEYFNGYNKNTKRKRSRDIPNDVASFNDYYGAVIKRFQKLKINTDKSPKWDDLEKVLFDWKQGTGKFKDAYSIIKKMIEEYIPYNKKMLGKLSKIDPTQRIYREKQSISLDKFLDWYNKTEQEMNALKNKAWRESRQNWLWVCAMCVTYGLRPTEVAAAKNLLKPVTIDGFTFKAISDKDNKELLLVLGNKTYFGVTIKTGERICTPMVKNERTIEQLSIRSIFLPRYEPKKGSKAASVRGSFAGVFRRRLSGWGCPVTQMYAFRHLANQLGEREGIPQEIRARSLGHSVQVNDSVYKKRSNIRTTVDLLTNHKKQPLSLDLALEALKAKGFDVEDDSDNSVKAVLRIVYQSEI